MSANGDELMDDNTIDYTDPENMMQSEGWWASVLAEEESSSEAKQEENQPQNKEKSVEAKNVDVDWSYVKQLLENEDIVTSTVKDFNKGGLLVQCDMFQGFVPVSHLDDVIALEDEEGREERLKEYIDSKLLLKVIECDSHRGRIVLSQRAAQTMPGQKQKLLDDLEIGHVVTGRTTNITDFGVFVDLGGVEGLIHISELSWGRVLHPRDYASIGEEITVMILNVNKEKSRVSLSVKRLEPNPWTDIGEKYPSGTIFEGQVTEIVKYGAFAKLQGGLEGLIHITEMGLEEGMTPASILEEGQIVKVEVVLVDSGRQRMSLRLVD
jgi:small subunit ribosomal protein S1